MNSLLKARGANYLVDYLELLMKPPHVICSEMNTNTVITALTKRLASLVIMTNWILGLDDYIFRILAVPS